eukprot:TRINITY_DN852_c0_g3_i6.p2 TRINITY_DN852_c0_g3~~TRINITY_DN852_c0_g3_i6.p2  ORF type:complete len:109 (-),score=14.34 TRINITY_DN852_c0_g3_i6:34-360(-)
MRKLASRTGRSLSRVASLWGKSSHRAPLVSNSIFARHFAAEDHDHAPAEMRNAVKKEEEPDFLECFKIFFDKAASLTKLNTDYRSAALYNAIEKIASVYEKSGLFLST